MTQLSDDLFRQMFGALVAEPGERPVSTGWACYATLAEAIDMFRANWRIRAHHRVETERYVANGWPREWFPKPQWFAHLEHG